MVLVKCFTKMEILILEHSQMGIEMEKGNIVMQMEISTKENGYKIKEKGME